jgi:hypothetical protein
MTLHKSPAELRKDIANAIAGLKSYDVPAFCVSVGLADGTKDEAFSSKFRYVMSRLNGLRGTELAAVARATLVEMPDPDLEEKLALFEQGTDRVVSDLTRRKILDVLDGWDLNGRMELFEFLDAVYPIDKLPSAYSPPDIFDPPYTLRHDITRHCIRNDDWSNSELLQRLGALTCSQRRFCAFLERVVDPVVRDTPAQEAIVSQLNQLLERDGFALLKVGAISGYPQYGVRRAAERGGTPADLELTESFKALDEGRVHEMWEKALKRRQDDPEGAITAARTLLEQTCKFILDETGEEYAHDADLPKLYALCAKQLNLAPDQHTETAFKTILGNAQQVVNTLATIRNRLGDSHGKSRAQVRPKPRHAQLAVNLAGSMAMFLIGTWQEQKSTD